LKFRSFEDDLIDDKTWQKELFIRQLNFPTLSEPIEIHLEKLENKIRLIVLFRPRKESIINSCNEIARF